MYQTEHLGTYTNQKGNRVSYHYDSYKGIYRVKVNDRTYAECYCIRDAYVIYNELFNM